MAIPLIASAAASAVAKYGPGAYEAAKTMLVKATNGKVSSPTQLVEYIGKSPQRLTVATDALVRSGSSVDEIFPVDIVRTNPTLMMMRNAAQELAVSLKGQFDAGADKVIGAASSDDAAKDVIRITRVQAVLRIYGDEKTYFLCHPNGGVPAGDFAHVRALQKALYTR